MAAKFPIPRPTETAALARLQPRRTPDRTALFSDLAVTRRRRDREGFGLVGHAILRAVLGRVGEP
ncbi:hypothetical protein [Streptacidiphilus carbonis]|uniref:hypothetical protein n=1 Tax=Streptacidiphilus carbonis TaxID=105422 RepID=UPI0005AA95B0|nr:hypothetical protein [Streptacidiphilus carbonis]